MGTTVRLTRSGGLAGIAMVASVDLDELPPATAEAVRAALAGVDFDDPGTPPPPGAADGYQYDVEVKDGGTRSVTAHDPFLSPGLRSLVDVLLPLAQPE